MDCRDIDRALIATGNFAAGQLPSPAQQHLASCDRCRELVRALNTSGGSDVPSPEVFRQIEQNLTSDLRAVRPILPLNYFFTAFVGIFSLILAFGAYRWGAFA